MDRHTDRQTIAPSQRGGRSANKMSSWNHPHPQPQPQPQPLSSYGIGGDLDTETSKTAKIDEGVAVFGSSHDASYGLSRVLKDASGTTAPHETDDVSDILGVDQGEQRGVPPSCPSPPSPNCLFLC